MYPFPTSSFINRFMEKQPGERQTRQHDAVTSTVHHVASSKTHAANCSLLALPRLPGTDPLAPCLPPSPPWRSASQLPPDRPAASRPQGCDASRPAPPSCVTVKSGPLRLRGCRQHPTHFSHTPLCWPLKSSLHKPPARAASSSSRHGAA